MKINNSYIIAFLAVISVLLTGCQKDTDQDYSEFLLGTWINTHVDYSSILTDETYTVEFKDDQTEVYAIGFQLDENNKSWEENDTYTYSIDGDIISIDGVDVLGKSYHMEFKIMTIDEQWFTYSIEKFTIDGEEFPDAKIYTCYKITSDFSASFTGVWYGQCTSEECADTAPHYWEYFSDGSYNYYFQDEDENWTKKLDNEGSYFLYGHLFVSNYTNDLVSGGTGQAFECWDFEITDETMVWTGWRENEQVVTYEMEKVSEPPVTK